MASESAQRDFMREAREGHAGQPRRTARPMLFDRLRDDGQGTGALLEAVLRDLSWLLNTACALDEHDARRYAEAGRSALNFGVPAFAGTPLSGIDTQYLENALREAIVCFEPRLQGESVEVRCVSDPQRASRHNVLTFEIAGRLACVEPPISMLLQTDLDLDSGFALLRPLNRSGDADSTSNRTRR